MSENEMYIKISKIFNNYNTLFLLGVSIFFILIFSFGIGIVSSTDTTSPKLVSSNPADGEQNVPINQRTVSFTFNEAMQSDISVTTWVNDSLDPDISSHDWSSDYEWSSPKQSDP